MKTGIVLWAPNNSGNVSKYLDTLDLDYAKGADIAKKGILQFDADNVANHEIRVDQAGVVIAGYEGGKVFTDRTVRKVKLHYFGEDGARRTGLNTIEFNDGNFTLNTNNSGDKGSVIDKKKYYSLGIALKADADLRYGIYNIATTSQLTHQNYERELAAGNYKVLTTSGSLQKGNSS